MAFAGCNSNVFFTFATRISDGIATGIWASSVLSTYINVLEGGTDVANERVGYAQAIQGTFLAVAAIPAGWLAMQYRRDAILRVMGLVAFAAIATTSAALLLSDEAVHGYKYVLLCGGLALWGVAQANAPVLDALFADSTTTGDRSRLYTWLHMSYIVSQGVGPGVGAVMFYLSGNVWKLEVLQNVMLVGMALACVPAALLLLGFNDDAALGVESEGLLAARAPLLTAGSGGGGGARDRDASWLSRASSGRPGGGGGGVGVGLSGGSFTADGSEGSGPTAGAALRLALGAAAAGGRAHRYSGCGDSVELSEGEDEEAGGGAGAGEDYRRRLLDGWDSDNEPSAYKAACGPGARPSPARPVVPAGAAAAGAGGSYSPPEVVVVTPPATAAAAAAAEAAGGDLGPAPPNVSSHALLLSPDTSTPATIRSVATTPGGVSPPPAASGRPSLQDNNYNVSTAAGAVAGAGNGPAGATANLPGVLGAAAAAAEAWRRQQGADPAAAAAAAATNGGGSDAAAGRFHAVRQAVDNAAGSGAAAAAAPAPPSMADCRAVSIFGGAIPSLDAAAEAAIAAAGASVEGEGEGGAAASGAGSELSFSTMLRPGAKKGGAKARNRYANAAAASADSARASGGSGLATFPEDAVEEGDEEEGEEVLVEQEEIRVVVGTSSSSGAKKAAAAAPAAASAAVAATETRPGGAAAEAKAQAPGVVAARGKAGTPALSLPEASADTSGGSAPPSDGPATPTFYAASGAAAGSKKQLSVATAAPAASGLGGAQAGGGAAAAMLPRSPPPIRTAAPAPTEDKGKDKDKDKKKDKDGKDKKDKKDKDKDRPAPTGPQEVIASPMAAAAAAAAAAISAAAAAERERMRTTGRRTSGEIGGGGSAAASPPGSPRASSTGMAGGGGLGAFGTPQLPFLSAAAAAAANLGGSAPSSPRAVPAAPGGAPAPLPHAPANLPLSPPRHLQGAIPRRPSRLSNSSGGADDLHLHPAATEPGGGGALGHHHHVPTQPQLTPPPGERQRLAKNTSGNDRVAPGVGGGGGSGAAISAFAAGARRVSGGGGGGGGREEPPPRLSARSAMLAEIHKRRFLCLTMAWIPGVLALTDCIMGLASGMTIKFFPIFFKDAVLLPPMYVNLMYCAIPLCLSSAAFVAQKQSRLLGRVQTMVLNRGLGITLLAWIASHPNHWREPRLMVPIYIARTSIMNSIYPLQKSILMDFVPKESRAAWNSLESITAFGWSGSAALGGWLIHKYGFQTTFIITALMQSMGWAMSMLLLPIVPRKEAGLKEAVVVTRRGSGSGVAGGAGVAGARGERRATSPGRR